MEQDLSTIKGQLLEKIQNKPTYLGISYSRQRNSQSQALDAENGTLGELHTATLK